MPEPQRCYIASPLGFDEGSWHYYRSVYLPALRKVVEVEDPWEAMPDVWDPARNPWQRASTERDRRRISLSIGEENARRIRACRWLVAYLEGQEPDSGTVVELGYAAGLGKLCFALRSDTRQAGEPGVRLNLQVEAIVVASGGAMYGSLDALVEGLRARQTGPAPS